MNYFHFRFDQLYPIVENIYYKELLLLELREELYHAQTQRERKEIQQILQATGKARKDSFFMLLFFLSKSRFSHK